MREKEPPPLSGTEKGLAKIIERFTEQASDPTRKLATDFQMAWGQAHALLTRDEERAKQILRQLTQIREAEIARRKAQKEE